MGNYHYFDDAEVARWQLEPEIWAMLDMARDKAGIPFLITRGRCTLQHEMSLAGGVSDSSHIKGFGVDLATQGDDHALCMIIVGLVLAGFRRFGIYHDANFSPHHVHVDNDPDLPPGVMWLKMEKNA
jgi:hypothetical protein